MLIRASANYPTAKFEAFSEELSSLGFYSVDVDAVPDVAEGMIDT